MGMSSSRKSLLAEEASLIELVQIGCAYNHAMLILKVAGGMMPMRLTLSILISASILLFANCSSTRNYLGTPPSQSTPTDSIDLFPVKQNGKWGFIDKTGQVKIAPQFDQAEGFSEGLAPVGFGERDMIKWGYIDKSGQIIMDPVFQRAYPFSEGMAAVEMKGRWGYLDKTGRMVIEPQYGFASDFAQGFAVVRTPMIRLGPLTISEPKTYFLDKQGNKLKLKVSDGKSFSQGLAAVSIDHKNGFINQAGQIQIEPKFDRADGFSEGLAVVVNNGSWGYIDQAGDVVIDLQLEEAQPFSEGLAAVKKDGEWSYIDKTGKQVFGTNFKLVGRFVEDRAKVIDKDGKSGFIDKEGKIIIPLQFYSSIEDFSHGLALVGVGDKYGYVDRFGEYIWKPSD